MSDYLRGIAAMLALLGFLLNPTPAMAYPDIGETAFAMWPADYCATATGEWHYVSGTGSNTHVSLTVITKSLRAPSGDCDTPSTAATNVFAAYARIEHKSGSTWSVCTSAPWAGNANATWFVSSIDTDLVLGCGTGDYRLRSENRITYGGSNQYSPPFLSGVMSV